MRSDADKLAEIIGFLRAWLATAGGDPADALRHGYADGSISGLIDDALALARALNRTIKL